MPRKKRRTRAEELGIYKEQVARMNELRQQGHTLKEIGSDFSITKQRVGELLVRYYGSTAILALLCRGRLARDSGIPESTLFNLERLGLLSPVRHGYFVLYQRSDIARTQEIVQQYRNRTRHGPRFVECICESCGIKFDRRKASICPNSPARFCSKHCLGKYAGVHYGFGATRKKVN